MNKEEAKILNHKLESIDARLDSIDKSMAVYNEQLKIHIKRTEMIESDLHPIKDHVNQIKGAGKLLGILAIISSIATAVLIILNGGS